MLRFQIIFQERKSIIFCKYVYLLFPWCFVNLTKSWKLNFWFHVNFQFFWKAFFKWEEADIYCALKPEHRLGFRGNSFFSVMFDFFQVGWWCSDFTNFKLKKNIKCLQNPKVWAHCPQNIIFEGTESRDAHCYRKMKKCIKAFYDTFFTA